MTQRTLSYTKKEIQHAVDTAIFFDTDDDDGNRANALGYWNTHQELAILHFDTHCYAVGSLALLSAGWELTSPEEIQSQL